MYKLLLILFVFTISCSKNSNSKKHINTQPKNKSEKVYKIDLNIKNKGQLKIGDLIEYKLKSNSKVKLDSIQLIRNGKILITSYNESISLNTKAMNTGKQKLSFSLFWSDGVMQSIDKTITLNSDILPQSYTYKVEHTWPHSTKSYTQGLEFSDGFLYEGTGEYGESMLSKVKLENNEIIQSINLPSEVFGEGITILNDKIYQLTWKSSIGFVYDKENLQKLYDFNYPTDGWGLTNNGKDLIMSDGSEIIYFLDTEYFSEIKRLEVYDEKGPVTRLNELELIDSLVYANIYGTNNIVAFSVNTGKVIKKINLTGLLNDKDIKTKVDVLNGIAWNNISKQLIVTGKWWPKLYHIELIETN